MINLILGKKGSGKTKKLIDYANNATGNVVMVVKGPNLTFDINHKVRLINIDDYKICDFCSLHGFICGLCAGNYDLTDILVDATLDICEDNIEEFNNFIKKLDLLTKKIEIQLIISASIDDVHLLANVKNIINTVT